MTERYYCFAGMEFRIQMPKEMMYSKERRLEPFAVQTVEKPYELRFKRVDSLSPPSGICLVEEDTFLIYKDGETYIRYNGRKPVAWNTAYLRSERNGNCCDVQLTKSEYSEQVSSNAVLESMAAEHLIARNHGFVFHCSYIDYNGKAVLFTAPSETGKSTQAELWRQYRGADIVNGDRAAIRLADGVLLAEGIPFAGSSDYCKNRSLPIGAIVYLAQAPVTTIRRMKGFEAFSKIWEGVSINTWDRVDVECVSAVVQKAAAEIPIYHMPCTPDESAVRVLEEVLRKQVNP